MPRRFLDIPTLPSTLGTSSFSSPPEEEKEEKGWLDTAARYGVQIVDAPAVLTGLRAGLNPETTYKQEFDLWKSRDWEKAQAETGGISTGDRLANMYRGARESQPEQQFGENTYNPVTLIPEAIREPVTEFVIELAGDIVEDPVALATLGGWGLLKGGGKALTKKAIKKVGAKNIKRLSGGLAKKEMAEQVIGSGMMAYGAVDATQAANALFEQGDTEEAIKMGVRAVLAAAAGGHVSGANRAMGRGISDLVNPSPVAPKSGDALAAARGALLGTTPGGVLRDPTGMPLLSESKPFEFAPEPPPTKQFSPEENLFTETPQWAPPEGAMDVPLPTKEEQTTIKGAIESIVGSTNKLIKKEGDKVKKGDSSQFFQSPEEAIDGNIEVLYYDRETEGINGGNYDNIPDISAGRTPEGRMFIGVKLDSPSLAAALHGDAAKNIRELVSHEIAHFLPGGTESKGGAFGRNIGPLDPAGGPRLSPEGALREGGHAGTAYVDEPFTDLTHMHRREQVSDALKGGSFEKLLKKVKGRKALPGAESLDIEAGSYRPDIAQLGEKLGMRGTGKALLSPEGVGGKGSAATVRGVRRPLEVGEFKGTHDSKTGTFGLQGPNGERIGGKILPDRINVEMVSKGSFEGSGTLRTTAMARQLGRVEGKDVYFTGQQQTLSGGKGADNRIRYGMVEETPEGLKLKDLPEVSEETLQAPGARVENAIMRARGRGDVRAAKPTPKPKPELPKKEKPITEKRDDDAYWESATKATLAASSLSGRSRKGGRGMQLLDQDLKDMEAVSSFLGKEGQHRFDELGLNYSTFRAMVENLNKTISSHKKDMSPSQWRRYESAYRVLTSRTRGGSRMTGTNPRAMKWKQEWLQENKGKSDADAQAAWMQKTEWGKAFDKDYRENGKQVRRLDSKFKSVKSIDEARGTASGRKDLREHLGNIDTELGAVEALLAQPIEGKTREVVNRRKVRLQAARRGFAEKATAARLQGEEAPAPPPKPEAPEEKKPTPDEERIAKETFARLFGKSEARIRRLRLDPEDITPPKVVLENMRRRAAKGKPFPKERRFGEKGGRLYPKAATKPADVAGTSIRGLEPAREMGVKQRQALSKSFEAEVRRTVEKETSSILDALEKATRESKPLGEKGIGRDVGGTEFEVSKRERRLQDPTHHTRRLNAITEMKNAVDESITKIDALSEVNPTLRDKWVATELRNALEDGQLKRDRLAAKGMEVPDTKAERAKGYEHPSLVEAIKEGREIDYNQEYFFNAKEWNEWREGLKANLQEEYVATIHRDDGEVAAHREKLMTEALVKIQRKLAQPRYRWFSTDLPDKFSSLKDMSLQLEGVGKKLKRLSGAPIAKGSTKLTRTVPKSGTDRPLTRSAAIIDLAEVPGYKGHPWKLEFEYSGKDWIDDRGALVSLYKAAQTKPDLKKKLTLEGKAETFEMDNPDFDPELPESPENPLTVADAQVPDDTFFQMMDELNTVLPGVLDAISRKKLDVMDTGTVREVRSGRTKSRVVAGERQGRETYMEGSTGRFRTRGKGVPEALSQKEEGKRKVLANKRAQVGEGPPAGKKAGEALVTNLEMAKKGTIEDIAGKGLKSNWEAQMARVKGASPGGIGYRLFATVDGKPRKVTANFERLEGDIAKAKGAVESAQETSPLKAMEGRAKLAHLEKVLADANFAFETFQSSLRTTKADVKALGPRIAPPKKPKPLPEKRRKPTFVAPPLKNVGDATSNRNLVRRIREKELTTDRDAALKRLIVEQQADIMGEKRRKAVPKGEAERLKKEAEREDQLSKEEFFNLMEDGVSEAKVRVRRRRPLSDEELAKIKNPYQKEAARLLNQSDPNDLPMVDGAVWNFIKQTFDVAVDVGALSRTALSTFDASNPLRQTLQITAAHPLLAAKRLVSMASTVSNKKFDLHMKRLHDGENYALAKAAGLNTPEFGGDTPEFRGGDVLEKIQEKGISIEGRQIPGVKTAAKAARAAVKPSENMYVYYQAKSMQDLFDHLVEKGTQRGAFGEGVAVGDQVRFLKDIATYVNAAGSRARIKAGKAKKVAEAAFFSPQMIKSRVESITDILTAGARYKSKTAKGVIRAQYMRSALGIGALTSTVYLGLKALGKEPEIEKDPRSSDFMKIRVGDVRIDTLGGLQQYARLGAQLASGKRKETSTGIVKKINRKDTMERFVRSKMAPLPGKAYDLTRGRDFSGEKPTLFSGDLFTPLGVKDIIEIHKEDEGLATVLALPIMLGIGAQSWSTGGDWRNSSEPVKKASRLVYGELRDLGLRGPRPGKRFATGGRDALGRKNYYSLSREEYKKFEADIMPTVMDSLKTYMSSPAYKTLSLEKRRRKIYQLIRRLNRNYGVSKRGGRRYATALDERKPS